MEEQEIINRVAGSSLVTFDLEAYHVPGERVIIDLKELLFQGMILREKDLREFVRTHEWSGYAGKFVGITCSTDAIIPVWAHMLVTSAVRPFADLVVFGGREVLERELFLRQLDKINWEQYRDARVVIKGCSKVYVPDSVYVDVTNRLRPLVLSLFFGEPCSTVPVFKRPRAEKKVE